MKKILEAMDENGDQILMNIENVDFIRFRKSEDDEIDSVEVATIGGHTVVISGEDAAELVGNFNRFVQ